MWRAEGRTISEESELSEESGATESRAAEAEEGGEAALKHRATTERLTRSRDAEAGDGAERQPPEDKPCGRGGRRGALC